ncbi:MAG TPA: CHAT domain-containing protein, partial [Gemmataceae bacterium]|nr:CHAT domain-containing protein [Gemmataceae bacterium]
RPRERTPLEWAGTVAALGTAYLHRAQLPQGENAAAGEEQAERPAARDLSQGIYWLEEARAVFQSQRSPESQAECLLNLGTGYAVRGRSADLQQAIACFREALTLYESLRQPVRAALVWNNLGAVHGRLTPPDHGEAGRCFRQAAELNARQGVHRETVVAFANLAAVQVDAGDWDAALASFAEAARWSAQEFVASLGEHGRLAWLRRQATVYDGLVAGHTLRAADARHAQQAACWAEQGRARHLADVMAGAERSPRGVQRAEQEEYRKTAHRLRDLDHQLETLAPGASDDCCEDLRTRRRLALEEVRRLRHRFAALDPEWAAGAAPLTAQEIGEVAAQAGAALLTLRPTHWGTAAVVVLPDGQIAATLFESFTEQILRKLLVGSERDGAGGWMTEYQRMRTGATPLASWRGTADMVLGHLGRDLWQPLLAWLAGLYRPANPLDEPRPLAILPGAGLSALPLHAAWWEDTGRRRWACDDYRISYAPSLWVLRRCLERSQRWAVRGAPDLLAVRNPTGDLQLAIREVDWIAPLFPHAASILGQADDAVYPPALRQRLLEELPRHAIALLSTHGTWDPLDPWTRSGLATADAATQPQLRLGDLFGLDLSGLRLAVLSACESALTDFRDVTGEQLGLPSAFLAAGAATVVGSLWLVEDRSTALLVRLFFEELLSREGSRPGVGLALWRAQRRLRELSGEDANALLEDLQAHRAQLRQLIPITFEADPVPVQNGPFAHPYYWAAFGCYGAF